MATRSLTKQFVEIRSACKANKSLRSRDEDDDFGNKGLLNSKVDNTNISSLKNTLPPVWVDKIQLIEENITLINAKIRELNELHRKRLMVNFETDEQQQEREIDLKTQEITNLFRTVEASLKKFSSQGDESKVSSEELKVRNNIQRSIAKRLQTLSQTFRGTQKEYLNKLNAQKTGDNNAFQYLEKPIKSGEVIDNGMTTAQIQMIDETEMIVNQRDEEITRIAKSIEELAQIFKELAVLVIDQGTILDRIDYNMESAVAHAQEGIVQLNKANEHQKNALPFRCIVLLVVLIAIMLGILVWKHSGK